MKSPAQRVVIADEQALCRAGLAALLTNMLPTVEIVQACNFSHMLAALSDSPTMMLAVDFGIPGLEGPTGLRKLRATNPMTLLVVIAESCEREVALEALGAGVHGYILKNAPTDEIIQAFNSIRSGRIYVPSLVSDISVQRSPAVPAVRSLRDEIMTARQLEVLEMVASGRSNKEIARSLQIAEGTVKVHVTAAFRALGVHNRVSAAAALQKRYRNNNTYSKVLRDPFRERDRRKAKVDDFFEGRHMPDGG